MFQSIRTALVNTYGSVGAMKTFVTDFELAAINSAKEVSPEVQMKGCSFHFRQALMRRIQQEGLQLAYNEKTEVADIQRHTEKMFWISK